jgi:hypothetical protein
MEDSEQLKADLFLINIYKKAWKDQFFLKCLVKNPIETLDKFTGKKGKLPKGKVLVVEDQTNPNHIYLNIPAKPVNYKDQVLDEHQLDHVTGASSNSLNHAFISLKAEIKNLFGC